MGIMLTDQQKAIVKEGVRFYKSTSQQVFEYGGYAGTGKSVVLAAIQQELGLDYCDIAPMAFIGQASLVMRTKGFFNAKTVHSWLYAPVFKEKKIDGKTVHDAYFNRPLYDMGFVNKGNIGDISAIFLDEAYSCPYKYKKDILATGKKIFATGDPGQLPPVKDKPAFLENIGTYPILDEIMRQNDGSSIIYLASRARTGQSIDLGNYGDAMVIEFKDLDLNNMYGADIIICGTNARKDAINNAFRNNIYNYNSTIPNHGEKVICRKNNWGLEVKGINLTNGLRGTVMNYPDVSSFNGRSFMIDFKPDLFNSQFNNITVDYKYFIGNNEQRQIIKTQPYSDGDKFEYAYATTCHISQGSQYNAGIYIEDYMGGGIQNNLNYTGITRFMNKLLYVKPPIRKYY